MTRRPVFALIFAGFVLSSCLVLAESAPNKITLPVPPLTYNAISDRKVYVPPPLPKLGPAGTSFVDPSFGCRVLRLTDGNILPDVPNSSFRTPANCGIKSWNVDSTRILSHDETVNRAVIFNFDRQNFTAKPMEVPGNPGKPFTIQSAYIEFSALDPDILFYLSSGRPWSIHEYNLKTQKDTVVLDIATLVPTITQASKLETDAADNRFAVDYGDAPGAPSYNVMVYDRKAKKYMTVNVKDSTVKMFDSDTPKPLNVNMECRSIHAEGLGPSGKFMDITGVPKDLSAAANTTHGHWMMDIERGTVTHILVRDLGHFNLGFSQRVNQPGNGEDGYGWCIRPLEDMEHPKQLLSQRPPPLSWCDGHPSWNNCRPDMMVPFLTECYGDARVKGPWEMEIIAVSTDGSDKAWRFCHHHSLNGEFYDTPRANVSQDGRYCAFTSNWEKSLGKDARTQKTMPTRGGRQMPTQEEGGGKKGGYKGDRQDEFVVELNKQ